MHTDIHQPVATPVSPMDPRMEMFQKREPTRPFFNMKALAPRPLSNATEMFDTDFEDDDSEVEEGDSPRISLNSVCYPTCVPNSSLTYWFSLVEGVKQHYHPSKKYKHQIHTHKSSRDSTLT